jgi:hypothetical protein
MTKDDFINMLKSAPLVTGVISLRPVGENEWGDKRYYVNVRKIDGNCINYENITFVVVDEGGPSEAAYFFQSQLVEFANYHEKGFAGLTDKAAVDAAVAAIAAEKVTP